MVTTKFIDENGKDVGEGLVDSGYLAKYYSGLIPWMQEYGLWLWGTNFGRLGDDTIISELSPVQTISGGTNWKQVHCGDNNTAAIKTDGTLWVWGFGSSGQIGDNTIISKSSPVQTISGGTNWKQVGCGYYHTAAIKTDGTLWSWGNNFYGRLGDNTTIHRSSPVQIISGGTNWKQVSCGYYHTAAIKTDGTLWLWGWGAYGQIGDNTRIDKSSPVQTIFGGNNWKQVSCGGTRTTAIKTDGTLWVWGSNYASSPIQTISGGTNWKQVSCGGSYTAAIKTDGTLWSWGVNYASSPIQTISGGNNWKQVSCQFPNTFAIKTDGSLFMIPNNNMVKAVKFEYGGNNWKQVSCGSNHTAAIASVED